MSDRLKKSCRYLRGDMSEVVRWPASILTLEARMASLIAPGQVREDLRYSDLKCSALLV